ncbi:YVTN repeat-like/Quino protein amine dehydrogenase [Cubamyces sp. BRFM 1775]|nr:YVTN repeat-like/Quino protein amine dehydrogenase [Cubamyces sp. BRFM 1775]
MATLPAWDIYANTLTPLGKGYPLWVPDPDHPEWEVEIGDVGYVRDGSFKHLLRTKNRAEDPQPHNQVPEGYVQFYNPNIVVTGPRESITQNMLHSRTIKQVNVSGGASVNAPMTVASPGANITFKCTDDKGALLLLSPHGEDTYIQSRRHIVTHLRQNLQKWETLANDTLGLDLKAEDILFVCGVTKTSRWAVAAFQSSQRNAEGSISCDMSSLASAHLTMSITNVTAPNCWYRSGPPQARRLSVSSNQSAPAGILGPVAMGSNASLASSATASDASTNAQQQQTQTVTPGFQIPTNLSVPSSGVVPDKADQCIFFHYYKMKRRWFPLPGRIVAGAGPHELPQNEDDTDANPSVLVDDDYVQVEYDDEFEQMPHYPKPFDPVTCVLDYILQHDIRQNSEADVAIASDLDLYALFKTPEEYPEDVATALSELQPQIELDEHRVGTLLVDITYNHELEPGNAETETEIQPDTQVSGGAHGGGEGGERAGNMDVDPPSVWFSTQARPLVTRRAAPPRAAQAKEAIRHMNGGDGTTHEGSVTALAYSASGDYLASASEDTSIIIWYARGLAVKRRFFAHEDTITALAFSPDGSRLASASDFGPVKIWDVEQPERELSLETETPVRSLAYTPDGSKLLGGTIAGQLVAWKTADLTWGAVEVDKIIISDHSAVISFITFSPDGRLMAAGSTENVCRIWEVDQLDSRQPKCILRGHRGMITCASFSPDGKRIVTASDDYSCRIWSTETGDALVNIHEHTAPVWSVCFAPDGKHVASGSADTTVNVCDSWTGERIVKLNGHDNMINHVVYSPDGRYVASASSDNTVRLWDAKDPEWNCLTTFNEHSDNVTAVMFSPDGSTLASGSHDGNVFVRLLQASSSGVNVE